MALELPLCDVMREAGTADDEIIQYEFLIRSLRRRIENIFPVEPSRRFPDRFLSEHHC